MQLDPIQEAQEKEEWIAYVPEIEVAIESGYLDDYLSKIQLMCSNRRSALGAPVKRARTKVGLVVPPSAPTQAAVQHPLLKKGLPLDGGQYGQFHYNGLNYNKWAVARSGDRPFIFRSEGTHKLDGYIVKVSKLNRTKGILTILGHIDPIKDQKIHQLGASYSGINASIISIIRCILQHNHEYGTE